MKDLVKIFSLTPFQRRPMTPTYISECLVKKKNIYKISIYHTVVIRKNIDVFQNVFFAYNAQMMLNRLKLCVL